MSLLTIWYFTVSKTTGRYQTSQLPTCFGYIDSTELLFEKKGSGKSHNLQLLTVYEVFYVYLCLLLTSFGNSPIKLPTQRFVVFFFKSKQEIKLTHYRRRHYQPHFPKALKAQCKQEISFNLRKNQQS